MSYPGSTPIKILIWLASATLYVVFIPCVVVRLFKKSKICPPIKDPILLLSAADIADRIRKQEISSEKVILSYITRIKEINPIVNAVIEDRFKAAIKDGKDADELISSGKFTIEELKVKHPLLGVPLTVKGSIEVSDMKSTSGMLSRRNVTATEDAVSVRRARQAGAIPLLTSNVPELCLNWETKNKVIGRTKNPYNTTRTVGGSSGGEACLLGAAGSLIGIGSDVGGSLRLPAHFCGVYGHKPSPGAVSYVGHYPSCKIDEVWKAAFTLGPMARYATDLKLMLQAILEPDMKDLLRLDAEVDVKKIKYYYLEQIDSCLLYKVNEEILEALRQVVTHLNTIGSKAKDCQMIKIPLMNHAPEMAPVALLDIDEVDNIFVGRGEGAYGELFKYFIGKSDSEFTSIAYGLLRKLSGRMPKSTVKHCKNAIKQLKDQLVDVLGNDGVLILPTFTSEAVFHGTMLQRSFDTGYMSIFNSMGLPVTNCPVTFTRKGLPIGIQIVGAPNCDRLTLAVAEEIEKAFGGWQPPKSNLSKS